ncbi:PREDICTED: sciellin [Condylura cristata]|uniref:sciellin n=1 Tax=Condylura cristata TaxID=143302 RepID=UPI000642D2FD|nr:PREDICTED: sciellin [Condylura cristata]
MSCSTLRKTPPTAKDMKSTTQGTTLKQQGFHELNKRRAFLQDNSWIKKRPEEERDENYGRVVLSRHNSHDALDRKTNGRDEPKATISRYRSDDTLDRISDRNDAVKTYKANTLDNRLTNRSLSTFRSPEATKMQPGGLLNTNTTNTPTSTSATTPVKKKRQSWFPPPPPGCNTTPSTGAIKRETTVHPPIPPKPNSPVASPHLPRRDNRQICPPKPGVHTEAHRSAERNLRSQDLENIVKVASSLQKTDKGEELDNLIQMNKSLSRNQGLDGLFRANPKTEQTEKRAKSLENLIFLNSLMDKDGKGSQDLGNPTKVNQKSDKQEKGQDFEMIITPNTRTDKNSLKLNLDHVIKVNPKRSEYSTGKQDLNGHIKVNPEINKNIKRGQSLENLIKVTPDVSRSSPSSKDLDKLIKMNPRTGKSMQGGQSLDNLIKVVPDTSRTHHRKQDLENLTKVVFSANKSSEQGLNELISVSPKAVKKMTGDQDLENIVEVNSNVSKHKNGRQDGHVNETADAVNNQSTRTSAYETRKTLSSNSETRNAGPKDTIVYTTTYVENRKSPKVGYRENVSGKYIQTVYSTSDRSVIERDMCTYCRKPLGTETKMILDELQICCHSTCFKCEICKQPLENLQAGDSIWIYRQTIHCEPCYSKVVAKWIQ